MMRHYSLMDGALVYEVLCESPLFTDAALPWYATLLPGEHRRIAGPILIDMDLLDAEDDATKRAVQEVLDGFPGRLHVSQLQSEKDLTTLANHLQRYAWFHDEDGLLLGLRFADTRILANLPAVFTPEQWAEMTAPLQQWTFLDRRGEGVILTLPEERASVVPENNPFALSIDQVDLLIKAVEPDNLLDTLNYTPHMMGDRLYHYWLLAKQCIDEWKQSGSTDRLVLKQFAINVFNSNGKILQEQDWVTLLARATPRDISSV